jgi:hypothetical protein
MKGTVFYCNHLKSGVELRYLVVSVAGTNRYKLLNLDSLNIMGHGSFGTMDDIIHYITKKIKCEIIETIMEEF